MEPTKLKDTTHFECSNKGRIRRADSDGEWHGSDSKGSLETVVI